MMDRSAIAVTIDTRCPTIVFNSLVCVDVSNNCRNLGAKPIIYNNCFVRIARSMLLDDDNNMERYFFHLLYEGDIGELLLFHR